ncbi:MAG: MFS transporter [Thermoleophilaceae bacterium]|nr:MFS transporter [Thermoleophilaceae bacterium]
MERKWWTLVVVSIATFMLLLDITIVNVALPSIQRSLGASFSDLQWVVDAYALTLATLLLTAGSLADLFGRRLAFVAGLLLFTAASLVCGLSGSPLMLILARGAQGIGGAIMFATSLALLAQAFSGRERGTAFGVWGAVIASAAAVGPLLGGALTDGLGWEYIFFINVPIGALAVLLSLRQLEESRDPEAGGVDWPGLLTFCAALFLLVFALIRANDEGWGSTQTIAELAGSAALLVVFTAVERYTSKPMLDLSLLRKPTFSGAAVVAFTLSAGIFAMFLYIALYIQNIVGLTPFQTGLAFLPMTVMSFVAAPIAGRLSDRVAPRVFFALGMLLVAVGLVLMHGVTPSSDWTALLAGFIVAGVGIGLTNPTIASAAIGVVAPQRAGMASGINSTFRQVGVATGIAGLGAAFQSQVQSRIADLLAGTPAAGTGLAKQVATGNFEQALASVPPQARSTAAQAARQGFVSGLNEILLIGAAIALAGAICGLALVRRRDYVAGAAQVRERAEPAAVA